MTQLAAAVFATFHVRIQIGPEPCNLERVCVCRSVRGTRELCARRSVTGNRYLQHANGSAGPLQRASVWAIAPFPSVQDKSRRIDRVNAPPARITTLTIGELFLGKPVAPTQVIPVI